MEVHVILNRTRPKRCCGQQTTLGHTIILNIKESNDKDVNTLIATSLGFTRLPKILFHQRQ